MSLQSRSVLFRQLLNTRECRTCSHFTAFSDNKFYTLHRNVFKSHPDTRSLRKLPTWATTQYLPHCYGKTPNSSIWVIPAVRQPGHDPPGWLRNPPWDFRWCFPALLTTLFIWTSWKWGSPASEKTKKKSVCGSIDRHQGGFGVTRSGDDGSTLLHDLVIREPHPAASGHSTFPPAPNNAVFYQKHRKFVSFLPASSFSSREKDFLKVLQWLKV